MPGPYGSMLHIPPTNYHIPAAKQESYQNAYLLTKNIEELSGEKFRRMGQYAEKRQGKKSKRGVGRRTRQKIVK